MTTGLLRFDETRTWEAGVITCLFQVSSTKGKRNGIHYWELSYTVSAEGVRIRDGYKLHLHVEIFECFLVFLYHVSQPTVCAVGNTHPGFVECPEIVDLLCEIVLIHNLKVMTHAFPRETTCSFQSIFTEFTFSTCDVCIFYTQAP